MLQVIMVGRLGCGLLLAGRILLGRRLVLMLLLLNLSLALDCLCLLLRLRQVW